jgi:hypothetical protein
VRGNTSISTHRYTKLIPRVDQCGVPCLRLVSLARLSASTRLQAVPCLEELFARSHKNLGVEAIDVLLLDGAELQLSFVGRAHFLERVLAAFRLFEQWRSKGACHARLLSTSDLPATLLMRMIVLATEGRFFFFLELEFPMWVMRWRSGCHDVHSLARWVSPHTKRPPSFSRRGCGSSLNAGHIKAYGLSAWTTFHLPASHPQSLSLEDVVDLAQQAGGFESNGFRYIQVSTTPCRWRCNLRSPLDASRGCLVKYRARSLARLSLPNATRELAVPRMTDRLLTAQLNIPLCTALPLQR